MLNIKVLGPGCANCECLEQLVYKALEQSGMEADVSKVTDPNVIIDHGVMNTPGLVINEETVCSGHLPSLPEVIGFLKHASP